jgi:hypothetical protein
VAIKKNLRCAQCGKTYEADLTADVVKCLHCQRSLPRIDQVTALLDEWYYPRRWQRNVDRPRARLLVERLWQQQFEPQSLYENLAPKETNFEVFCYNVTGIVINGIQDGWIKLTLPKDPMADDPIYNLEISNLERFTTEMEKAMPDVNWDEDVEITVTPPTASSDAAQATES